MKMFSHKKICVLFCGDIFGLPEKRLADWLDQMPELQVIADIDSAFVYGEKTADIQPAIWLKLAGTIYQKYNRYDGFVVIHNIDNLLFTASSLSFLLQNLSKPIIFTSGQIQGKTALFKKSGIKANLINACRAATENLAEVAVMFGNRLLRANQASVKDYSSLNIFEAPESGFLGHVDFSLRIFSRAKKRNNNRVDFFEKINTNIGIIEPTPLLTEKGFMAIASSRDGLIIKASNEFLPQKLETKIKNLVNKIPVVVFSEAGKIQPIKNNLIFIDNMVLTSVLTKFSWALGQSKDKNKIRRLMIKDMAGEIVL